MARKKRFETVNGRLVEVTASADVKPSRANSPSFPNPKDPLYDYNAPGISLKEKIQRRRRWEKAQLEG